MSGVHVGSHREVRRKPHGYVRFRASVAVTVTLLAGVGWSTSSATGLVVDQSAAPGQLHPSSVTGWSAPRLVHESSGSGLRVSCPSTTFCMAMDHYGWYETFDGTTWSAPARVVPDSSLRELFPLGAYVSCLSSTFCMAVESNDQYTQDDGSAQDEIWDGTSWSSPSPLPMPHALSATCASQTLCFATDEVGDISTYSDGTWAGPVQVDPVGALYSISCASATFCMAVGEADPGYFPWAYQFDGSTWSASPHSETHNHFYDVSCPSTTYCMAVASGSYATYDGSSWTRPHALPVSYTTRGDVSCAQPGTCMVTDASYWEEDSGGVWQTGHLYGDSKQVWPEDLACPTVTECVALISPGEGMDVGGVHGVQGYGYASVFDGTGWSQNPPLIDPARIQPSGVSCPLAGSCVVVDRSGWAFTRTNGVLSPPFQLDGEGSQILSNVTCASTAFCMAADEDGRVATFDFAGHVSLQMVDPHGGLRSMSCGAPTLCLGVTSDHEIIQYDGTAWSAPFSPQPGFFASGVSCVGTHFCMAVGDLSDRQSESTSYDGSTWTPLVALSQIDEPSLLSCGTPTLCAVQSGWPWVQVYSPLGCGTGDACWGPPVAMQTNSTHNALICGSTICFLGTDGPDGSDEQTHVNTWQNGTWSGDVMLTDEGGINGATCTPKKDVCTVSVRDFAYVYHHRG